MCLKKERRAVTYNDHVYPSIIPENLLTRVSGGSCLSFTALSVVRAKRTTRWGRERQNYLFISTVSRTENKRTLIRSARDGVKLGDKVAIAEPTTRRQSSLSLWQRCSAYILIRVALIMHKSLRQPQSVILTGEKFILRETLSRNFLCTLLSARESKTELTRELRRSPDWYIPRMLQRARKMRRTVAIRHVYETATTTEASNKWP